MQANDRITDQIHHLGFHAITGTVQCDIATCLSDAVADKLAGLVDMRGGGVIRPIDHISDIPGMLPHLDGHVLLLELADWQASSLDLVSRICRNTSDLAVIVLAPPGTQSQITDLFAAGIDDMVPKDEVTAAWLHRLINIVVLRRANVAKVRAWEDRLHGMVEYATIGIFQTTPDGRYLLANPTLADLYGFDGPTEMISAFTDIGEQLYVDARRREDFARLMKTDGEVIGFESEIRRKDGQQIWISEHARAVSGPDGKVLYYEGFVRDITERVQHEERLRYLAQRDVLTSLPNRALYQETLQAAMEKAARTGRYMALLFVDLDDFKSINDTMGHTTGDLVLQRVARRLVANLHEEDTVARFSGDEFAVILEDLGSVDRAGEIAARLSNSLAAPMQIGDRKIYTSASIGIAICPDNGQDPEMLMQKADVATVHAKSLGRNMCRFYAETMGEAAVRRLDIENGLRNAIANDELYLVYQPKIDLRDGKIMGSEALLRWQHPQMGLVSPDEFIPVAEDSGQIKEIGAFVLRQACQQIMQWKSDGIDPGRIAVNLSARQFHQAGFVDDVDAILQETGMDPHILELELTEGAFVAHVEEAVETLHALNARGIQISIDDFGTGYSSLAYLKRFPISTLKIDRSFVMNIPNDQEDMSITRAIISLAKSLDLDIVAEGIEEATQSTFLQALGVEYGQGWHYGKPMKPDAFAAVLLPGACSNPE